MSDFERGNPLALELSEAALTQLHDELAKVLILRGQPQEAPGVYPAKAGDVTPRRFSYPLDPAFLKQLYFADDDVIIQKGYIEYVTPHRLDETDPEAVDQFVYMSVGYQIPSPALSPADQLTADLSFRIGAMSAGEPISGTTETEYLRGGVYMSPNDLPRKEFSGITAEDIEAISRDRQALQHDLTLEDGERLAKVADYIQAHPRID